MDDLIGLSTRLEGTIARGGARWVRRVMVVRETESTQDFARSTAEGPGLLVVAGRQTRGRGRLGRRWADTSHLGLAMTFVLDGRALAAERLAVAAGVAACRATEESLDGMGRVGLRWPNDVVQRELGGGPGRKLAGVLVEQEKGLAFVGVGVNVLQARGDWPEELAARVTSLRELGSLCDRPLMAERVMVEMERALSTGPDELAAEWTRHDVLVGRTGAFFHDGVVYRGTVEKIEPTSQIRLRTADGEVRLPALTTSMVHE